MSRNNVQEVKHHVILTKHVVKCTVEVMDAVLTKMPFAVRMANPAALGVPNVTW